MKRIQIILAAAVMLLGARQLTAAPLSMVVDWEPLWLVWSPDVVDMSELPTAFVVPQDGAGYTAFGSTATLTGPDGGTTIASAILYSLIFPQAGTFRFNWSYLSNDDGVGDDGNGNLLALPFYDPAGFFIGTDRRLFGGLNPFDESDLFNINDIIARSTPINGSVEIAIGAGERFNFYVQSRDNLGGNAVLTISNADFAEAIPEPTSTVLFTGGLIVFAGARLLKRRTSRSNA